MVNKDWYFCKMLVQCIVEGDTTPHSCDEQVHLILASDPEEAYGKALQIGKDGEVTYNNEYGGLVSWKFLGVTELALVEYPIEDGVEIYSRLSDCDQPEQRIPAKNDLTVFYNMRGMSRKD